MKIIQRIRERKKQKPKYNMWQNSAYMIALAWREKEKKVLVLALLTAVLVVASNLIGLYITPLILSAVENKIPISELMGMILVFAGLLMLCSAASSYIGANTIYGRVQVRSALITALNRKASTTSYPNVGDEAFRKLCAKASESVSNNMQATEAIWGTLSELVKNVLGFVCYVLLLASLDGWMLLVILATTLIGYFISKRLSEYGYRHREEVAEYENKMWYMDRVANDFGSAKDIRIFGLKPWLEELGGKAMDALTAFYRRADGVYFWSRIADLALAMIRNGVAYAYLIHRVLTNGLSAAEFLLYFTAVGGFTGWVSGILGNLAALHRQSLDISTVRECMEYPEPFDLEHGEPLEPDKQADYEIQLEHVCFRYPQGDKNTLEDINLTLRPGEKLAVVGLNGAGKTTLVKLLCGFYDPTEGRVLLNGKDIREYNRRDYYNMFSAVFQDFSLLPASIAANIAQTEDNVDMNRVKQCAAQAGLVEKIESLPNGFETKLNREIFDDAVMLSGGETQRLMLARALYQDAPVILLDEPTAALDPIAESELYQKYGEMTGGKLSLYISHRLASTRFCDRILLIEDNHIIEEGTHDELLRLGGRYAELFSIQSKYYREEGDDVEA